MRRTCYTATWVLPVSRPPIRDGAVIVQGGTIVAVDTQSRLLPPESEADMRIVPLGNTALMPGLVNAHSHLELTALRGYLEQRDFRDWLHSLTVIRRDLMSADVLLDASRAGIREALRHGITTLADATDSGAPLSAMHEAGIRGLAYIEVFGPDAAHCDDAMTRLRTRVTAFRERDTSLVRTGISPHAPYTVSAPLFRAVATYAREEALSIAVHVAESAAESDFVVRGAGPFAERLRARGMHVQPLARSPIALLEETGILAARPLLIHAIRVDDDDLAQVRDAGATIVHCPISNAKLGQGLAPLDRMLSHGIATGLGTDSVASNDRMDLLGEARQAALFSALRAGVPDALPAARALELATLGGAKALGLEGAIGSLEVGKAADLVAFSLGHPDAQPVYDPVVTLIHALAGKVEALLVTVAGRELLRDGVIVAAENGVTERLATFAERLEQWRIPAPA